MQSIACRTFISSVPQRERCAYRNTGLKISRLYRFADYKEKVVDLLARVAAVSVATVRITREMSGARR